MAASKNSKSSGARGMFDFFTKRSKAVQALIVVAVVTVVGVGTVWLTHAASYAYIYLDPNPYAASCGVVQDGIPHIVLREKKNNHGPCVRYLQWDLNQYFGLHTLKVNGLYDATVTKYVKKFQRQTDLYVNGVADTPTWYRLRDFECKVSSVVSSNACTYVSVPVSSVSGVSGVSGVSEVSQ